MPLGGEAGGAVDFRDRVVQRSLEPGRCRHVLDGTTCRAHEMVVVVPGEIFRKLEARVLVVRDDAMHDTGLFEDDEVAIDAALCQSAPSVEDLGDRERASRRSEHVDEGGAVARHSLVDAS